VRQIRDGNLGYRIEYSESDEFAPVCDDFNRMAGRLEQAGAARERDEQSRRELIAGISHDLRTPLTSIKAYVEGLEQGVASTPDARKRYLDTIRSKTADLEHIIEHLFLFSKLDTGEFPYRVGRVDLGAVVSETASGVSEEYAERGLDISAAVPGTPVFTEIDAERMRYVLINIFENSLKYKNKERGRLSAEVRRERGRAVLTLSDDGPGVPDAALPRLFDLFYRGDGARSGASRGSGLGLAIAAKMVRRFGGEISAKNSDGGGLSIEITLPEAGAKD
jgi:signal transduction histidine kinase